MKKFIRDFSFSDSESDFSDFSSCNSDYKTPSILFFYNSGIVSNGIIYLNRGSSSVIESVTQILLPLSGTLKNLIIKTSIPPGINNSRIIKIRINSVDTPLILTLNNNEISVSLNKSLSVNKGDLISVQAETTGNLDYSVIYVSLEFVQN